MNPKVHHEQIKIENALSDITLDLTGEYAELWLLAHRWGLERKTVEALEGVINAVARQEWGQETKTEYDYENAKIHVTNGKRGKTFEANDNA